MESKYNDQFAELPTLRLHMADAKPEVLLQHVKKIIVIVFQFWRPKRNISYMCHHIKF